MVVRVEVYWYFHNYGSVRVNMVMRVNMVTHGDNEQLAEKRDDICVALPT